MGPAIVIALGLAVGASGLDLRAGYVLCLRDTYDWDSTIAACTAVIDSPAATAHMKFRAYGHRAVARFHGKQDYPGSIDDISQSIALEPDNARGYQVRASIRYEREDYAAAIPDLNEVLSREPENRDALTYRSTSLSRTKRLDLAITDQKEVVRLKPDDGNMIWTLAGLYEEGKDFDHARETYNRVLALDHGWAREFPPACFADDPLYDLAMNSYPTPVLKNWPACEKSGR
ncbi:MAG: tetratricopeptide repeat protein [Alphaproteobacteria bacterium]